MSFRPMRRAGHGIAPGWLNRGVVGVGVASLLSDLSHEIPTALLPNLVTQTLGAPASALGLIEGVSDGLAGAAKLAGGPLADEPSRRGPIAVGGYTTTAVLSLAPAADSVRCWVISRGHAARDASGRSGPHPGSRPGPRRPLLRRTQLAPLLHPPARGTGHADHVAEQVAEYVQQDGPLTATEVEDLAARLSKVLKPA